MSDTTKQLVQIIHDMGVISERMDEKNKLIESQQATITELTADREDCIREVRDTFESAAIEAWKKDNADLRAKVEELKKPVEDGEVKAVLSLCQTPSTYFQASAVSQ